MLLKQRYMQPIAIHRQHVERLLLIDDVGCWFLWMGEMGEDPIEIPWHLAMYLVNREEVLELEAHQRLWFVVEDLPVRGFAHPTLDVAVQEPAH